MSPPRLALAGLILLVASGCPGSAPAPKPSPPPSQPEPAVVQDAPAQEPEPPPPEPAAPPPNALQREARFVDRKVFLEQHPNATELAKNVINASDPISAAAQGYFAAVSNLTINAFQYDLKLWYQLNNERWPTFAEYQEILSKHDIKFKGLKPRQVYAYDSTNGQLSILEVPEGETIE